MLKWRDDTRKNQAAKICFDAYSAKIEQMAWILEDKI